MDSPTRDLLNTLDNAGKSLEIMEEHQREYERNLEEFDANMREGGSDFLNSGATGQVDLKKLIAHHKGKALNQEQPTHIQPGVGILHGTIIGAKGLGFAYVSHLHVRSVALVETDRAVVSIPFHLGRIAMCAPGTTIPVLLRRRLDREGAGAVVR